GNHRRAELHGHAVGSAGPTTACADTDTDTDADANATPAHADAHAHAHANAAAANTNADADADPPATAGADARTRAAAGPSASRLLGKDIQPVGKLSDGDVHRGRKHHLGERLDQFQRLQVQRLEKRPLS